MEEMLLRIFRQLGKTECSHLIQLYLQRKNDYKTFEDYCNHVLERKYRTQHPLGFNRYGHSGQRQDGIDIISRDTYDGKYTVAQCKCYSAANRKGLINSLDESISKFCASDLKKCTREYIIMLSLQNDCKCTDFARGIIDQYGLQVTVMFEDEIDKLFLELISEKLEEKRIKDEKAEANFTLAEKTADQECEAAKKKAEQNRDNAIALAKSERKIVKENNDFSCLDSISTGQSEDSPPARDVARGKNEEIVEKVYFSSEPQKILPSDLDHKEKTYGKQ